MCCEEESQTASNRSCSPNPVSGPWEIIACDCSGPYPTTRRGNEYVVAFTCYSTRWVEARLPSDVALLPLREMTASVAEHRARVVEQTEIARCIAAQSTQRAQQKMKDLHDGFAEPTKFHLGDRCWVFTPKQKKGVSPKLMHAWHGPYRIVEFLFPVHCVFRALDNRRVSTTVHVSRMKRYIDPADRPTRPPPITVDEPYLADTDLPSDSFLQKQQIRKFPLTIFSGKRRVKLRPKSRLIYSDHKSKASNDRFSPCTVKSLPSTSSHSRN